MSAGLDRPGQDVPKRADAPTAAAATRHGASRRLVLALVLTAQLLVVLDATIVTVALPSIQSRLSFDSPLSLQWVINAYILLFGGFLLLGGRAGDLYGRRTLFVIGLTVFTGASLINGLAQSTGMLIVGRAAQGLGAGLVVPAVLSIIVATFTHDADRREALAVFAAVSAMGGAIGLLLGGFLTELLSWRWIFLVNIPVGAVAVLLALKYVPNSRAEMTTRSMDIPGAISVTGGFSLLSFAVVTAQGWGWASPQFVLTGAAAAILLVAFVAIEVRSRTPLVRLGIFTSRSLSAANVSMFLFQASQYTMLFFPTLYMQDVLGYGPLRTGLAYLPWSALFAAGSFLGQRLIPRVGARPTIVIGLACAGAGLLALSTLPDHGSYAADILPGFVINPLGAGLTFPALVFVATADVRADEAGVASGIISTSNLLGSAIGLAVLATIASSTTSGLLVGSSWSIPHLHALVAGFDRGMFVAGLLPIAAALVAILARRPSGRTA